MIHSLYDMICIMIQLLLIRYITGTLNMILNVKFEYCWDCHICRKLFSICAFTKFAKYSEIVIVENGIHQFIFTVAFKKKIFTQKNSYNAAEAFISLNGVSMFMSAIFFSQNYKTNWTNTDQNSGNLMNKLNQTKKNCGESDSL